VSPRTEASLVRDNSLLVRETLRIDIHALGKFFRGTLKNNGSVTSAPLPDCYMVQEQKLFAVAASVECDCRTLLVQGRGSVSSLRNRPSILFKSRFLGTRVSLPPGTAIEFIEPFESDSVRMGSNVEVQISTRSTAGAARPPRAPSMWPLRVSLFRRGAELSRDRPRAVE
jgi:hypothetical protein